MIVMLGNISLSKPGFNRCSCRLSVFSVSVFAAVSSLDEVITTLPYVGYNQSCVVTGGWVGGGKGICRRL